jgi:putative addiction module killer protein
MFEVRRTGEFIDWLTRLRDVQARARIAKRIDRLVQGNFGDAKSVGNGVSELRFTFVPGYRVYYTTRGRAVVILLCGGDKGSQTQDIERAIAMAREIA